MLLLGELKIINSVKKSPGHFFLDISRSVVSLGKVGKYLSAFTLLLIHSKPKVKTDPQWAPLCFTLPFILSEI